MTEFSIMLLYFVLLGASVARLKTMKYDALNFSDGAFIGSLFFIAAPLLLISFDGVYFVPEMTKSLTYAPFVDYTVTLNLLLGWSVTLAMSYAARNAGARLYIPRGASSIRVDASIFLLIYFFTVVLTFIMSGKAEEGNWMDKMGAALQQNTFLILIGVLKNVYRAMIYGFLIFSAEKSKISKINCLYIGLLVAGVDLLLTFNRVTAAYLFIMILIIFRHRILTISFVAVMSWPLISFLSTVWTFVRANATQNGLSFAGVYYAFEQGFYANSTFQSGTISEQSNGIFETSNIMAFSYIMNIYPKYVEPLWGWTFLLRPLSIFIPSTFWPGKPPVFGVILGEHMMGITVALNSTLFGEAYANFFYFWPIAIIAAILFYTWLFSILSKYVPYASHLGFMVGFLVGRMELTVASIAVLGVVILYGCVWVVRRLFLRNAYSRIISSNHQPLR